MAINHRYLPYSETGYFSELVTDYLAGKEELAPFYSFAPTKEGIAEAIQQRSKFQVDRKTLVSVLRKQYEGLELSEKLERNIELLADENTYTVCTAHQPNLLTGYLYFVYKILHAIKLAEELKEQYPDKNFVPVYYMGSEDNDLEELNRFRFNGDTYVWDAEGQKGAVGRMKTTGLKRLLDEVFKLFGPPGENCETLKDILQKAYLEQRTMAGATQYLVNELYGRYGLVILNPDEAEFKRSILAIIKDDLLNETAQGIVAGQLRKLTEHYKAQAQPRAINLFYLTEGLRARIEKKGDGWIVIDTNIKWTEDELLKELNEQPERFSPNVILRGLLQESILPDVAFIGGGGEVAYWLQLKPLFEHYKVFYPAICLRQSVLWVEPGQMRAIVKSGFSSEDIFIPESELVKRYIKKHGDTNWQTDKETAAIEKIIKELQEKAGSLDATLHAAAEAVLVKIKHQLVSLEKKMLRAEKRKMQEQLLRINKWKKSLFPNDGLQERVENFSTYFLTYGSTYFDVIKDAIEPYRSQFLIIESKA